jgi:hypothetical protein
MAQNSAAKHAAQQNYTIHLQDGFIAAVILIMKKPYPQMAQI